MDIAITASRTECLVELIREKEIVAHKLWQHSPSSGRDMLVTIDGLLHEQGLELKEVKTVNIQMNDTWSSLERTITVTAQAIALATGASIVTGD